MQVKLSQLINRPVKGNLRGYCVFCGTKTERGSPLSKVVSNNFSAFPLLRSGDTVCEYCTGVFSNQDFRNQINTGDKRVVFFRTTRKELEHLLKEIVELRKEAL